MAKISTLVNRIYQVLMPILIIALGFQCALTTFYNRKLKKEIQTKWQAGARTIQLTPLETLKPGEKVPAFTAQDLNGTERTVASNGSSKKTLLFAFTTTCPVCKANNPNWKDLYQKIDRNQWEIIGLSLDELEKTKTYVSEHAFEFPILPMKEKKDILNQYKIRRVPTTLAIDQNQTVQKVWVGNLQNQIPEVEKNLGISK